VHLVGFIVKIIESVSYFHPTMPLEVRRFPTFRPSPIFYKNFTNYPREEESLVVNIIPYIQRATGNSHHFVVPYLSFPAATCFGHRIWPSSRSYNLHRLIQLKLQSVVCKWQNVHIGVCLHTV